MHTQIQNGYRYSSNIPATVENTGRRPRSLFAFAVVIFAVLFLQGCEKQESWTPPFEPMVCGMDEYTWINPRDMGTPIYIELDLILSLHRGGIESMLNNTEYAGALDIKYGADIYWVRYETQDRGVKLEATTVLGVPHLEEGGSDSLDAPLVLWLHGTTGFMDDCAPSVERLEGAAPALLLASQGYLVTAPDYIGMNGFGEPSEMFHPYLVGEPTAIASWDSVRAAEKTLEAESSSVSLDGRVIIWGASQGGHGAFFSELYAPYYAPEYEVAATVALIAPTNLIRQTESALMTFSSSTQLTAAALVQMARWHGMGERLDEFLTNHHPTYIAEQLVHLMDSTCDIRLDEYEIQEVTDIFKEDFVDGVLENDWHGYEEWKCLMGENSVAYTSVPRISDTPFLFVLSENDRLVDTPMEREEFSRLCDMGYRMEYIECAQASHSNGAIWSLPEQLEWVKLRLSSTELSRPCILEEPLCCSGSPETVCTP